MPKLGVDTPASEATLPRGQLLLFGSFNEATHPRVRVLRQGLAEHLASLQVINEPLEFSTADRVGLARKPWRAPLLVKQLLHPWVKLAKRRLSATPPDAVLVGYMGQFDVHLARLCFPRSTLILDYMVGLGDTASDRQMGPLTQRVLALIDHLALRQADIVLCDTTEQKAFLPTWAGDKSIVVPVGAPDEWYDAGSARHISPECGPLRVVFFGLYTPLQGTPLIARAIAAALRGGADLRVTMIGDGQDRAKVDSILGGFKQVRFLDWVPSDSLPRIVAEHDVCLGIFGSTSKANRVVPNKVFQGIAAGCKVVTSDTEAQRNVLGRTCTYVSTTSETALAEELIRLAHDRVDHNLQPQAADFRPNVIALALLSAIDF